MMGDGYKYTHDKKLVTVFSAANYCYKCGNSGAVLNVDENL